jgi:hypothetical protein
VRKGLPTAFTSQTQRDRARLLPRLRRGRARAGLNLPPGHENENCPTSPHEETPETNPSGRCKTLRRTVWSDTSARLVFRTRWENTCCELGQDQSRLQRGCAWATANPPTLRDILMEQSNDPIFQRIDVQGWFFWNETWSESYGPYDTEEIARENLREYCETL